MAEWKKTLVKVRFSSELSLLIRLVSIIECSYITKSFLKIYNFKAVKKFRLLEVFLYIWISATLDQLDTDFLFLYKHLSHLLRGLVNWSIPSHFLIAGIIYRPGFPRRKIWRTIWETIIVVRSGCLHLAPLSPWT